LDALLLADLDSLRLGETDLEGEGEPDGEADLDSDATSVPGTLQIAEVELPVLI